jgi:hypothetical protein
MRLWKGLACATNIVGRDGLYFAGSVSLRRQYIWTDQDITAEQ